MIDGEKIGRIEKVWAFLEGKKTAIGLGVLLVNAIICSKYSQFTSPEISKVVESIGWTIAGVGFADKGRRSEAGKKWLSKLSGKK